MAVRRRHDGPFYNAWKKLPPVLWYHTFGKRGSLREWIEFAACYPECVKFVFETITFDEMNDNDIHCLLDTFVTAAVEHILIRNFLDRGKVVILDEGIVHRVFTIFAYKGNVPGPTIKRFINACPQPDALIFVDTDPVICLKRLENRAAPLTRLEKYPRSRWIDFLDHGRQCLKTAVDDIKPRGIPVYEVDGQSSLEEIVEYLTQQMALLRLNR